MKISTLLTLFPLLMPASVLAGTVLYTDSHHPPSNVDASVSVIYLDGPDQLQTQTFGELSSNPDEAERQAKAILQSPQWRTHEQELATVYRAVVRAWELGVTKVPAVVFDDKDVVYGTADVAQAVALRAQSSGGAVICSEPLFMVCLRGNTGLPSNLHFKYADAIGHPATSLIGGSIAGYSCRSAATPFVPYFLSTLDSLAWRTGMPESLYPEALVPGQREVGSQGAANMWGNVYPRSGFVTQVDDDKAGALVAQRVADIITRSGQPHVYQPLMGQRSEGYWPPGAVKENTGTSNHKWQRLAPQLSQSCAVFPDGDHPAAADANAAFALWQPYSCCQRQGQRFLYSTDF